MKFELTELFEEVVKLPHGIDMLRYHRIVLLYNEVSSEHKVSLDAC